MKCPKAFNSYKKNRSLPFLALSSTCRTEKLLFYSSGHSTISDIENQDEASASSWFVLTLASYGPVYKRSFNS